MASAALQEGAVFAGRYRIVREHASGGMGAVYEVVHNVTERRCALKVMLSHTVEREQLRKRFMQESRLAAQIGSEYIVDVLDAGVDEATKAPYLVMELLEGEDLDQRLLRQAAAQPRRDRRVSPGTSRSRWIARTRPASFTETSRRAISSSPGVEDGTALVKVLDFGVAKVLTLERSGEHRTQTVGTPIYMAPEQFRAEGRISPATDIYALGMLAYTLLVGVHYWTREHERCENPFSFASIAVHGPQDSVRPRARSANVTLPPAFDDWFFRATSRWPQDRFPSATTAVSELALALGVNSGGAVASDRERRDARAELRRRTPAAGDDRIALRATHRDRPRAQLPTAAGNMPPNARGTGSNTPKVSLSVTSGGLPLVAGEHLPSRGRGSGIAAAFAVAAVVAAAFVGLSIYSSANHETVKTNAAVRPPASATAPAPAKPADPRAASPASKSFRSAPPERHIDVAHRSEPTTHRVGAGHTRRIRRPAPTIVPTARTRAASPRRARPRPTRLRHLRGRSRITTASMVETERRSPQRPSSHGTRSCADR